MHTATGGCHCGNIRVELEMTRPPEAYNPRTCDCDFCSKHGAAYVSDPKGALRIRLKEEGQTSRYRQGSGQAELLLCRNCGVLASALFNEDGRLYAAVNARVVERAAQFGTPQAVSPKTLSAGEKVRRWQDIWFPNVSIVTPNS